MNTRAAKLGAYHFISRVLGRQLDVGVPVWTRQLERSSDWRQALDSSRAGLPVLIATSTGGSQSAAIVESILAAALTLRGASVKILLCDSFLPACQMTEISAVTPEQLLQDRRPRCWSCHLTGREIFQRLGVPIFWFGQLVSRSARGRAEELAANLPLEQLASFRPDGIAAGEHALAGALRYFARGDLKGEPVGEHILRKYLYASLLTIEATEKLLQRHPIVTACFNHGLYVPQGLIGEVCRKNRVRVVNWNPAYRKHCFVFSHGDTYHHTMVSEPVSEWESMELTPALQARTTDYLKSRWKGTHDWISFHRDPITSMQQIGKELKADPSSPWIALLTSVMWDAQLHYSSNAFSNMLEWVVETVRYFIARPELQLIIRIHPGELTGGVPSRQLLAAEIEKAFPSLPANIHVIRPESPVSTYAIVERSNAVLIYNTKTGIEVASMGIPTIVAGEAWIRNKGFSIDVTCPQDYFKTLDTLPFPERMDENQKERALKYAFHFFFRRMIPLDFLVPADRFRFLAELEDVHDLLPGRHPGLDVICDGIMKGTPFIYPAEHE